MKHITVQRASSRHPDEIPSPHVSLAPWRLGSWSELARIFTGRNPVGDTSAGIAKLAIAASALMVCVLPIPHTAPLRNLFFYFLLALTLYSSWHSRHVRQVLIRLPLRWPWLLFGCVALMSIFYAKDPWYSLGEFKSEIFVSFSCLAIFYLWLHDLEAIRFLLAVLALANVIIVSVGLYVLATELANPPENLASWLIAPLDIGVGKFSTYVLMVIPFVGLFWKFVAPERSSRLFIPVILLNFVVLVGTFNRASVLVFCVLAAVMVLLLQPHPSYSVPRRNLVILATSFFAVALVAGAVIFAIKTRQGDILSYLRDDSRILIWAEALRLIREQPLTGGGIGIEAFTLRFPDWRTQLPPGPHWHAHNVILDYGVQMGIPGIIAFCLLLVATVRSLWPSRGDAEFCHLISSAGITLVIVTLAKNMTDDFFRRDLAWLFWILIALCLRARALYSNEDRDERRS